MSTMKFHHFLLFQLLFLASTITVAQQRGFQQINLTVDGQTQALYSGSHALVIGVSNYTNGWPDLPGVKNDILAVKDALEKNNFNVMIVEDANDEEIEAALDDFIEEYGVNPDNRLLIYFAGHGHTMKARDGRQMGYIVPTNAPLPEVSSSQFHRKAISMRKFDGWAREILSKHALFLFDACFSGSLFNLSRAVPAAINYNTSKPVRQFITSGSAEEQVPDRSIFREYFVKAITTGDADASNDGYLTGSELSSYIFDKVSNYSYDQQHPQSGKIRDQYLDKGDFVFVLNTQTMEPIVPNKVVITDEEKIIRYGSIELTTEISGSLFLDGTFLKQVSKDTRMTLNDVSAGTHTLKIVGDETWQENVAISKNLTSRTTAKSTRHNVNRYDWEPEMVFVKGGTFTMGCTSEQSDCYDEEKPTHQVTVSDFYIGKYEVTQKLWLEVMGASAALSNPSDFKNCDNCPVEGECWDDVQEFIKTLNQKARKNYRLPTEAEWEYAAQGGSKSRGYKYAGSNNIGKVAWYYKNSYGKGENHKNYGINIVGKKKPNELGLYDMSGNVMEWCSDWLGSYSNSSQINPKGPTNGNGYNHVIRGGAWSRGSFSCRVVFRDGNIPYIGGGLWIGFRLVLDP